MTREMIYKDEALKAIETALNVKCDKCGQPRNDHQYRHPFVSSETVDFKAAIAALPAVTVAPRYVFADGETIEEMRYKFLASKEGQALYAQGDVKLAWVNEGDLYHPQPAALDLTPAPVTGACDCIGQHGPNPDCGRCGGDGDAAPVTRPMIAQPVRYCPICDIADCATHRPAPAQPDPAAPIIARTVDDVMRVFPSDGNEEARWIADTEAGVYDTDMPDPAAIREAARVGGQAAVDLLLRMEPDASLLKKQMMRAAIANPILALIQKEPTDDRA